jgi:hypothetical protein
MQAGLPLPAQRQHPCLVSVKRRQLRLTSGRMCSALASLLGTQRSSFLYDTLLCEDGSYDADPVVIHRSIQRHYMRHFAVDQDSLLQRFQLDLPDLGSAATWDVFLLDPDAMVQAFLHPANGATPTVVPQEFVEAIAAGYFCGSGSSVANPHAADPFHLG